VVALCRLAKNYKRMKFAPDGFLSNEEIKMMIKKILLMLGVVALAACNATTPVVAETKKEVKPYVYVPRISVSIECISHDGAPYISQFYVGEPTRNRMAGGGSCGGSIAAGYLLPNTWTPGMKVKVRWKPNGRDFIEKTTNIIRYEEAGTRRLRRRASSQALRGIPRCGRDTAGVVKA
jgi:hypothetical protein